MNRPRTLKHIDSFTQGFSLIELVIVIVVLSIIAVTLGTMAAQMMSARAVDQDIQNAAQLAQECGDHIIAARRFNNAIKYANVTGSTFCSSVLAAFPNFDSVVTAITSHNSASLAACPSATAGSCKLIAITVTRGSATFARAQLLLVNY